MKKAIFPVMLILVMLVTTLAFSGCTRDSASVVDPSKNTKTLATVAQLNKTANPSDVSYSSGGGTAVAGVQAVGEPVSFADMAERVLPCVAFINALSAPDSNGAIVSSAGTGVILRPDGYILTNKHVIEGFKSVEVTLNDRRVFKAVNTWLDDLMDLAVVKIDVNEELPTVPFADPKKIRVGDRAFAFGHALGLSPQEGGASVTSGIVSNLGRSFKIGDTAYFDVVQTDAAINHGNSGGPLVNSAGELIAINSAGVSTADGVGYAINVASARHVFEDIVTYGKTVHPYLGVKVEDLTLDKAPLIQLSCLCGAYVTSVVSKGPAESAGLKRGDIIETLNGNEIESTADLMKYLWRLEVGSAVEIEFYREGILKQVTITVPERPAGEAI